MRNKILFTVLLVGTLTFGALYVHVYDKVKADQAATLTAQTESQKKANAEESARAAKEAAEKARLAAECQDGLVAYNKLTPVQQKATPKPECDLQQIQ
jgi:hypothetical protein